MFIFDIYTIFASVKQGINIIILSILTLLGIAVASAKKVQLEPSYAWTVTSPLGDKEPSTIDTLQYNYQRQAVPSLVSHAWASTGNLGGEGINMIYFDRPQYSEFFLMDALQPWLPQQRYFNTRTPMTLLSFNTGGREDKRQDRLRALFSANVNSKLAFGGEFDYLYSRGYYECQADKDITWRLFGSYIGDKYEVQGYFNNFSLLNKENGGVKDDRYINNLVEVSGGDDKIDSKNIPVNLNAAHSKISGRQLFLNQRYKLGFYKHERDSVTDSIVSSKYIPVTSFVWTFGYNDYRHKFINTKAIEDTAFFKHNYLSLSGTDDNNGMWEISNTLGIHLHEGFHKYAKFGLSAYATHIYRKFYQTTDTALRSENLPPKLTPLPEGMKFPLKYSENVVRIGGRLSKQSGSLLTYNAGAEIEVCGESVGEFFVDGNIDVKFKLFGDSVKVTAYGGFYNTDAPYLMKHYFSNHYVWDNDFKKSQRFKAGGILNIPHTKSYLNIGVENIKNYVYFNNASLPSQYGKNIQIFSATLKQRLNFKILHWDNELTYQTTSNKEVLPLPNFAIYSNLYMQFKIAKVLNVQLGVDCNYYTKYRALAYNPAIMAFHTQDEGVEVGNYPFMNVYLNCKLKKARFFVMMTHINQGWFSNDYFSAAHYPLNPRRFQMGVSVDFAN